MTLRRVHLELARDNDFPTAAVDAATSSSRRSTTRAICCRRVEEVARRVPGAPLRAGRAGRPRLAGAPPRRLVGLRLQSQYRAPTTRRGSNSTRTASYPANTCRSPSTTACSAPSSSRRSSTRIERASIGPSGPSKVKTEYRSRAAEVWRADERLAASARIARDRTQSRRLVAGPVGGVVRAFPPIAAAACRRWCGRPARCR